MYRITLKWYDNFFLLKWLRIFVHSLKKKLTMNLEIAYLEFEKTPWPSSALLCLELKYFYCAYVNGFRSPSPDLLTSIVIRYPMMGERGFVFPNKRRGKKSSWIIISTPANASPLSQVTRWRNIHSDLILRTTAA